MGDIFQYFKAVHVQCPKDVDPASMHVMAALFDDLAWAFDTPPRAVIELALARLGVPAYFIRLLRDIDNHARRDTVLAGATAWEILGEYHRVLFGTAQGSVEGPSLWLAVQDIIVDWAQKKSKQPVQMDAGPLGHAELTSATFVDDSGYVQGGETDEEAVAALAELADITGLINYFLGLRRRPKKCVFARLAFIRGRLQRMSERDPTTRFLRISEWVAEWTSGQPVIVRHPAQVPESEYDYEFRHLGYTASLAGTERKRMAELRQEAKAMAAGIQAKPWLKRWARSIIEMVVIPKLVYPLAFSRARIEDIRKIERGYSTALRHSMQVAATTSWAVIAGDEKRGGMGAQRLEDVVMCTRAQHLAQMTRFGTDSERAVMRAALWQAWVYFGERTPPTELSRKQAGDLKIDGAAPWAAVALHQLAINGYKLRGVDWGDKAAANDVPLRHAVPADSATQLQLVDEWRRARGILWLSQMLRADGRTLRARYQRDVAEARAESGKLAEWMKRLFPEHGRSRVAVGHLLKPAIWRLQRGDVVRTAAGPMVIMGMATTGRWGRRLTQMDGGAAARRRWESGDSEEHLEDDEILSICDASLSTVAGRAGYVLEVGEPLLGVAAERDNCDMAPQSELGWAWWSDRDAVVKHVHGTVNVRLEDNDKIAEARAELARVTAAAAALAGAANVKLEMYADGSVTHDGARGAAALTAYVDDALAVAVSLPIKPMRGRLSSTRTERIGLAMAYAVAEEVDAGIEAELRIDNMGAVKTANKLEQPEPRRFFHEDDADVVTWVRQKASSRAPIATKWIKAHVGAGTEVERTIHHDRNDGVDGLTKQPEPIDAIMSLTTADQGGGVRFTYTTHELEGCDTESELHQPVRAHMRRTAALARTLDCWGEAEKRHGYDYGRAGQYIETAIAQDRGRGNNFVVKLLNDLLPDGARINMYGGKLRSATCICGCAYERQSHILLTCQHPLARQMRKHWRDDIVDEVAKYRADGATAFVRALWRIDNSGNIEGAVEAEDGGFNGAWADAGLENVTLERAEEMGSDSDDEEGESGDGEAQDAFILAPGLGSQLGYEHDFNGINRAPDPRQRVWDLLTQEIPKRISVKDWWMLKWSSDVPGLIGRWLEIGQGDVLKLLRKLEQRRNQWADSIWKEHQREARLESSAVYQQERSELMAAWADTKKAIDERGVRGPGGRVMFTPAQVEERRWRNEVIKARHKEWQQALRADRRRYPGQSKIPQWFKPAANGPQGHDATRATTMDAGQANTTNNGDDSGGSAGDRGGDGEAVPGGAVGQRPRRRARQADRVENRGPISPQNRRKRQDAKRSPKKRQLTIQESIARRWHSGKRLPEHRGEGDESRPTAPMSDASEAGSEGYGTDMEGDPG